MNDTNSPNSVASPQVFENNDEMPPLVLPPPAINPRNLQFLNAPLPAGPPPIPLPQQQPEQPGYMKSTVSSRNKRRSRTKRRGGKRKKRKTRKKKRKTRRKTRKKRRRKSRKKRKTRRRKKGGMPGRTSAFQKPSLKRNKTVASNLAGLADQSKSQHAKRTLTRTGFKATQSSLRKQQPVTFRPVPSQSQPPQSLPQPPQSLPQLLGDLQLVDNDSADEEVAGIMNQNP